MFLRLSAALAAALTLAHVHADTETLSRRGILPIGREIIVKRDVVEQIRILRSKPAVQNSKSVKGTKKMKKKAKSMSKRSTKSSKGVKGDLSSEESEDAASDDKEASTEETTEDRENEDTASDDREASTEDRENEEGGAGEEIDISDCDSYSNDWLLELADYCGPDLENLTGCQCPTAGNLLAEGILTCARPNQTNSSPPACPEGCPVCEFCMVLEGCEDIYD